MESNIFTRFGNENIGIFEGKLLFKKPHGKKSRYYSGDIEGAIEGNKTGREKKFEFRRSTLAGLKRKAVGVILLK